MATDQSPAHLDLHDVQAVLTRTPAVLSAMLDGLPDALINATEGEGTWSPFDVIGHLIHGEQTDWIPRARHILAGSTEPFATFDREAQFEASAGRMLGQLLVEFADLRCANLAVLSEMNLNGGDLNRIGTHPELGVVTLGELLATWVVHDLDHIAQVARTMAKVHASDVGPWSAYLSILRDRTER